MSKKVKVTTKCGEVHTYDYDQEVDTVEIVEKKIYRLQSVFDRAFELLGTDCCGLCPDCSFVGNEGICTMLRALKMLHTAQGYEANKDD